MIKLYSFDDEVAEIDLPANLISPQNPNKFDIPGVIVWGDRVFVGTVSGGYREAFAWRVPTTLAPTPEFITVRSAAKTGPGTAPIVGHTNQPAPATKPITQSQNTTAKKF